MLLIILRAFWPQKKKLFLVFEVRKMWEKITKFNWGREDIVQSCGEITAKYSQSSHSLSRLKVWKWKDIIWLLSKEGKKSKISFWSFFWITQKLDMKKFSVSVQVAICWHRAWPLKPNNAHWCWGYSGGIRGILDTTLPFSKGFLWLQCVLRVLKIIAKNRDIATLTVKL